MAQGNERDFRPRKTLDNLPQSHPLRRKKVSRDLTRKNLLSTVTLMNLLKSAGNPVIDSGENVMGLSKDVHPLANVFDPNDPQHVLETDWYCQDKYLAPSNKSWSMVALMLLFTAGV